MLELSGQQFKTNKINMLRTLVVKVDSIQEPKNNVSKKVEIFQKNQKAKRKLEIKHCIEMRTAFDRLSGEPWI